MARRISFFVFSLVLIAVDAESARRRRQTSTLPCPLQCSQALSQAWSKAISFEVPSSNMVNTPITKNDPISVMCDIFGENQQCLRVCAASDKAYALYTSFQPKECNNQNSEIQPFVSCLVQNATQFRRICQKENEELFAASVQLSPSSSSTTADSNATKYFCRKALDQAYCIFPVLSQTCGDDSVESIRSIFKSSLDIIRSSVQDDVIKAFYPTCDDYFKLIEGGALFSSGKASPSWASNNDTTPFSNQTMAGLNATSTPLDPSSTRGQRPSPNRDLATTPSAASVIYLSNFCLFFISVLFSV